MPLAKVRACVHVTCCMRGSERIYETLVRELPAEEASVEKTADCTRFCEQGPNIAVNGNVLHGMRLGNAISRVRQEIAHPSRKVDAAGTQSLDQLDSVLDDLLS